MFNTNLVASFACLPARSISNEILLLKIYNNKITDLTSKLADIKKFTGISSRRYAYTHEAASDLAIKAVEALFLHKKFLRAEIQSLLLATTSGDYPSPATANFVHQALKLNADVHCVDIASSCTSFISALRAAGGFLTGANSTALVIASEVKHKILDPSDLRTLSLFADGAGGIYLEQNGERKTKFYFAYQAINSQLAKNICIFAGGSRNHYNASDKNAFYLQFTEPKKMFVYTVQAIVQAVLEMYDKLSKNFGDYTLNLIFIHQANKNILLEVKQRLPIYLAQKIPILMADIGNMVCASLPVLRLRVKFLQAIIYQYNRSFPVSQLVEVFVKICASNADFNYEIYNGGIVFSCIFAGETLALYDDGCIELASCWLSQICAEEFIYFQENLIKAKKNGVDFWIAAGGGFQTLGLMHF